MMMLPRSRKKRSGIPPARLLRGGRGLRLDAGAAAFGQRFQCGDVYRTKSGSPPTVFPELNDLLAELVVRVESILGDNLVGA
jgi:hypothetical protein